VLAALVALLASPSPTTLWRQHCSLCHAAEPHTPTAHLAAPSVCAAAAVAQRVLQAPAWEAALDSLGLQEAAEACLFRLALAATAGDGQVEADIALDCDSLCDSAVGAYAARRLGLLPAGSEGEAAPGPAPWRSLPPWLLAAACAAPSDGGLGAAYVAALLAPVGSVSAEAAALRRDDAARLRCVMAAGERAAERARRVLQDWGCFYSEPPSKRQRTCG